MSWGRDEAGQRRAGSSESTRGARALSPTSRPSGPGAPAERQTCRPWPTCRSGGRRAQCRCAQCPPRQATTRKPTGSLEGGHTHGPVPAPSCQVLGSCTPRGAARKQQGPGRGLYLQRPGRVAPLPEAARHLPRRTQGEVVNNGACESLISLHPASPRTAACNRRLIADKHEWGEESGRRPVLACRHRVPGTAALECPHGHSGHKGLCQNWGRRDRNVHIPPTTSVRPSGIRALSGPRMLSWWGSAEAAPGRLGESLSHHSSALSAPRASIPRRQLIRPPKLRGSRRPGGGSRLRSTLRLQRTEHPHACALPSPVRGAEDQRRKAPSLEASGNSAWVPVRTWQRWAPATLTNVSARSPGSLTAPLAGKGFRGWGGDAPRATVCCSR